MPAFPVLGAHVCRVYVNAHYVDTGRKLYNTFYLGSIDGPITEERCNEVVLPIMSEIVTHYIPTCSSDIEFDPVVFRTVDNPSTLLYEGLQFRSPSGQAGDPAPRAMAVNLVVKADNAYGRSQRNRVAQFGVPLWAIDVVQQSQYAPAFVAERIHWLQHLINNTDLGVLWMAVYSPLHKLAYTAQRVYETNVAGCRDTRMHGHKKK